MGFVFLAGHICKSYAQSLHIAQEGCSDVSGTIAYLIVQREVKNITAIKCSSNTVEVLFTKSISNDVILPPLCVSNGVVVVSVDGVVTKFGFDGTQKFSIRVLKNEEVSKLTGRWDAGTVYLTAMTYEGSNRKPRYRLLWIDVIGSGPVYKGEVDIGEPMKTFRLENDIVVCGRSNTERIAAPKDVRHY